MPRWSNVKKGVALANGCLMLFVAVMTAIFARCGATYMVYHSIPTIASHVALFWAIEKEKMGLYAWLTTVSITAYMAAATICLGYDSGFHLYCMGMILVAFYMEYMARKFHTKTVPALPVSLALVAIYLFAAEYAVSHGPVYEISARAIRICLVVNIISTCAVLIGYSFMLHRIVLDSENQLSNIALTDQLTGLYNRHYMLTRLDEPGRKVTPEHWVAMVDIDDFKRFNDMYGHACGDYVLVSLGRIMREECGGCAIARWGGEEFLIANDSPAQSPDLLEKLRQRVEGTGLHFQGQSLTVTVTIGMARYAEGSSVDSWIQRADHKLYEGKNSGKNRVVT